MHPILIQLGPLPIHTFGVLMGTAFLVGILYALRQARKWGLDPDEIFNLTFWIMLSGVLGARILYILVDLAQKGSASEFYGVRALIFRVFAIWEGGLVWYGGMICATAVVFFYAWRYKMPVWRVVDILTPATFFGLAIGRIGCLVAGDDFGRVTTVPWAITFHNPAALVYPSSLIGQPLHPTQVYMFTKSFCVALICHFYLKHRKRFDGEVLIVGFAIYPILRSFVELYRGDAKRGFFPGTNGLLTTSQGIGVLVFAFAMGLLFYLRRRATTPVHDPELL